MTALYPIHDALAEQAAIDATRRAHERQFMRVSGDERWYVTWTSPRFSENQADDLFEEYGCEYYIPKVRKFVPIPLRRLSLRQRRSGVAYREPKLVRLLPGYLFARLDRRSGDWRELFQRCHIRGVLFLEREAVPLPITQREIDKLRAFEVDGAIPATVSVRKLAYELGEVVRVIEGPFCGFNGTVDYLPDAPIGDVDEEIRIKIGVMMFGQVSLVELPISAIEKL
jgi:transcription termination/antitermination protein NusG